MEIIIARGLLIPFIGTVLGSMCVLFMKDKLDAGLQRALAGFAAGVMIAAAIWSLIIPAMDMCAYMGKLSFLPAVIGFCIGMAFLLLLDVITPHMHLDSSVEGPKTALNKYTMMVLAVALHNIPEGMAVGVVYAGWASGKADVSEVAALILAVGIAIQNFPEGAIISMPLHSSGMSKKKACWMGILSGIVEPLAGLLTIMITSLVVPILPYLQGFAAGAMFYVVVEELIPDMSEGEHSNFATLMFMAGFSVMLALDVALG